MLLTLAPPVRPGTTGKSSGTGDPEPGETLLGETVTSPRHDDYFRALARGRAWLDALEVDAADLAKHRVKGKKKLGEIIEAYWILSTRGENDDEQAAILARVRQLLEQIEKAGYHNLIEADPGELTGASMPYLQIPWIMEQFGLDNSAYLDEVRKAQPRLDRHMGQVDRHDHRYGRYWGPWQLTWFARFYERLGLEKPAILRNVNMSQGVIARQVRPIALDTVTASDLTHEILVAFDWGRASTQELFDAQALPYISKALDHITRRGVQGRDAEVVAAGVSSMSYLGWRDDPACLLGIDYLLDNQNKNGSWGDYELSRPEWGDYLDAHAYLHTTMVSIRALVAAFDRD